MTFVTKSGCHFSEGPLRMWAKRLPAASGAIAAVLAVGVFGGAAFTAAAGSSGQDTVMRLAGTDRYATAAAVSSDRFAVGTPIAYLATGTDFPDAVAAAAAAGGRGPVLLTAPDSVPPSTSSELRRLRPNRVVVVGGASAVSDGTLNEVRALLPTVPVVRTIGTDRFITAAELSRGAFPGGARLAFVATGFDYPDALAAAAAAGGRGPVLLTRPDGVPTPTLTELRRLGVSKIVVVGGSNAVSDAAFLSIAEAVPSAPMTRVAGEDRYTTASALAASNVGSGMGPSQVYLATGATFPDALAAAAAAVGRGPVLLTAPNVVPSATMSMIRKLTPSQIIIVGGLGAVGASIETQVRLTTPNAAREASVSGKPALALATARAQLGKPYLWAAAGPDAFDCSGLTLVAWKAAGVSLPHNAAAQAAMVPAVPLSEIQPGDLLFYGNPIYHMALYAGGGQMIEAAHSGTLVRLVDVRAFDLISAGRPA